MFKAFVQRRLESYTRRYFLAHPEVKLVTVVGSVGKTTTKLAIATVLAEKYRVRVHQGNFNGELSAPVVMLGATFPTNLKSISQWRQTFRQMRARIKAPTDVDIIVQELATSGIGQVPHFGTYLTPDITVVTAVTHEHMVYFGTIEQVAAEELSAVNYSKQAIINRDDIEGRFSSLITNPNISTYGTSTAAEYAMTADDIALEGSEAIFRSKEWGERHVLLHVLGDHGVRATAAAGAVGIKMGLTVEQVEAGLTKCRPFKGRMNILRGMEDAIIIDDSYNASLASAVAALRVLYKLEAPQKIAVFGSMNELAAYSAEHHQELGKLCDPSQLAHVITVGEDAEKYLAPAARATGCHVVSFKTAIEAGAYVHKAMETGAIVLFKGSQDNIYLEEAIKVILHATEEEASLVRQSKEWLDIKQQFFEQQLGPKPPASL